MTQSEVILAYLAAADLRRSHTLAGSDDWLDDDDAKADYDRLIGLARDARAMVERWKA